VAFALYTSKFVHEGRRFMVFEPKNDAFLVIGKVVAPLLFAICHDELQPELNEWIYGDFCFTRFSVRLLDSFTYFGSNGRLSNISVSENSLVRGMSVSSHVGVGGKRTSFG
jgi:hypothetical protein